MKSWKYKPGEAVFYISEALIGLIMMPSRASIACWQIKNQPFVMQLWKLIIFNPENDKQFGGVREQRWRAALAHVKHCGLIFEHQSAASVWSCG